MGADTTHRAVLDVDRSRQGCQHARMVEVQAIPAFRDNYIWLIVGEGESPAVAIVDPGDGGPVMRTLAQRGLVPTTLLITHHPSQRSRRRRRSLVRPLSADGVRAGR